MSFSVPQCGQGQCSDALLTWQELGTACVPLQQERKERADTSLGTLSTSMKESESI